MISEDCMMCVLKFDYILKGFTLIPKSRRHSHFSRMVLIDTHRSHLSPRPISHPVVNPFSIVEQLIHHLECRVGRRHVKKKKRDVKIKRHVRARSRRCACSATSRGQAAAQSTVSEPGVGL